MSGEHEDSGTVKAVQTVFALIKALKREDSVGVTALADELGLAKSSTHKHLKTLEQLGYVVRNGDEYELSLKFLTLGGFVRDNDRICRAASAHVERLAVETERLATFLVREGDFGVFTHICNDTYGITDENPLGQQCLLHQNAGGKAILASLDDEEVRGIVDRQGLPSATGNTITDSTTLFEEIDQIRERGFAISVQERVRGVDAIGASVRDPESDTYGAITVTAPGDQMTAETLEEAYSDIVIEAANELELQARFL